MTTGTGRDNEHWVFPKGAAAQGDYATVIDAGIDGWQHTMLRVAEISEGASVTHDSGVEETIVVPLNGSVRVEVTDEDGTAHDIVLAGRAHVFASATDVVYAGRGAVVRVTAEGGPARVALTGAPATKLAAPKPFRHIRADEVPVEIRGAGTSSREVRSFGLPEVLDADSILVCEVITPAGNWSSWPPHKHDTETDEETQLEEIYYFELQPTDPRGTDPVGYQRVYGSNEQPERPIDVVAEVRSGDVVLVPYGWHGPAMAAPTADLYYLNVMAGPGAERAWRICMDPAHVWVRDAWSDLPPDPRLPFTAGR
ncbi:MAG: 5-deoxy-glucuronate isomerase [Actinobacteria bacterium]|nr:5-deoxy-glucuronate isomerase [Actinomycetota bacterium]